MKIRSIWAMLLVAVSAVVNVAEANDSSYMGTGAVLAPQEDSDIEVRKEVLTFELLNDNTTLVTVNYIFFNNGPEKTITMGFETNTYCSGKALSVTGGNPNMENFKTIFNGKELPCEAKLVLDENFIEIMKEENLSIEEIGDCEGGVTYAYSFQATFPHGQSTLTQTYRYNNSNSVERAFMIPYKLTPANRWANSGIDDFTLIIKAPRGKRTFIVEGDNVLTNAVWTNASGNAKKKVFTKRKIKESISSYDENDEYVQKTLYLPEFTVNSGGAIKAHIKNYSPKEELMIKSTRRCTY